MNAKCLRLPYYPGCTLKTAASVFETSALACAEVLGMELVEIPRWNCCGTVFSLTDDDLIHHVAPIRNLIRVQEMNRDGILEGENRLVTLCSMCFNTLKRASLLARDKPDSLKTLNDFMSLEEDYAGDVEVVHFLELLRDLGTEAMAEKVKRPLAGLKVAPYYGCTLLKPGEVGIDDAEEPTIQRDIFAALGAEVVNHPYMRLCCGSYQTMGEKEAVVRLAHDILDRARKEGAEVVATSCPLCAFNLDSRQGEIKEAYPDFEKIPVVYFTQLMARAFGLAPESYESDQNRVSTEALFREEQPVLE
ncbi:CoB--CoM heterodisulfide reductase iron-sulfur subunit B family protein [Candidatus Eisenbacteria bacterium]|uniref:CoB--CoM heterodisulfide reductase iron-sulfur subunit B family protein n=1 Tax=Eiseniibacteriota bacterium TaxID=2212470 RepID=A0ABV6YPW4_UNCEI